MSLNMKCQRSAYLRFLCFLQIQTYWIACPGGLRHGSTYKDCPYTCPYSEIVSIRITRHVFPVHNIRGMTRCLTSCPTPSHLPCDKYRAGFTCFYIHCAQHQNPRKKEFSERLRGRGEAARKGLCIKPAHFKNSNYLALPFPRSNQLLASTLLRSYWRWNFWSEALGYAPTEDPFQKGK